MHKSSFIYEHFYRKTKYIEKFVKSNHSKINFDYARRSSLTKISLKATVLVRKKVDFTEKKIQWAHIVEICKFFPHDILQKFRQINFFTKELYCKSIWRKIFTVGENFRNYHTVSEKFTLTEKIFRQIISSKTVVFTNCLPKMRESEFLKLPHCDINSEQ